MSLIATRLQNLRVSNPLFDKNMTRPLEYGALDFFVEQTYATNSILSSELQQKAFASMGNVVEIPVIDYDGDVEVSNVRSCVIGDDENTSHLFTINWQTLAVGFTMTPSLYLNNEISYEHDFARKMEKVSRALASAMDTLAIASLSANKTQKFEDLLYYQNVGNAVQIPFEARADWFSDVDTIMRANAYASPLHIVGNGGIDSTLRKIAQLGQYNEENKAIQFNGKTFHFSNNVVNESGKFATAYVVADGNVGVLTRVDREALRRTKANSHEWDVVNLPFINLPVGSHYYTSVGDQSQIAGESSADMTCVMKEYFGFSVDVAFIVAYNSDAENIANPIVKVEIESGNYPFARPVSIVNTAENPVPTREV